MLATDLGCLAPEAAKEIETHRERTSKLTWGLYKSVSRSEQNAVSRAARAPEHE